MKKGHLCSEMLAWKKSLWGNIWSNPWYYFIYLLNNFLSIEKYVEQCSQRIFCNNWSFFIFCLLGFTKSLVEIQHDFSFIITRKHEIFSWTYEMGCENLRSRAKAWDLTSLLREFHWTPSNYSVYSLASDLVRLIEMKITEAQIRITVNVRLIGYRQYLNSDSKHICSIMLWTFIISNVITFLQMEFHTVVENSTRFSNFEMRRWKIDSREKRSLFSYFE